MVKHQVPVAQSSRARSGGPRLGRVGDQQNLSARPNRGDARPTDGRRLWLLTTLAASAAAASLIGIGFLASQNERHGETASAGRVSSGMQAAHRRATMAALGPPALTGSIALEPVEVTSPVALRGSLYTVYDMLPTYSAPAQAAVLRSAADEAQPARPPVRLASLAPLAGTSLGRARAAPDLDPPVKERALVVAPGDTISALLEQNGVDDAQGQALVDALRTVFSPKALRAGQDVSLTSTEGRDGETRVLALRLGTDFGEVVVNRTSKGGFEAALDGLPPGTPRHYRTIASIEGSLYGTARGQKVPDSIIVRMMHTHSYDVDFQREIHPGDTFEMFYARGGERDGPAGARGTLLFSSLTTGGKKRGYYRFTTPDGETDYYDESGVSSKKPLMRTPIDGARISSRFGMRKHPILGYSKMHAGTDFAAPSGTPILAAGDGKVDFAGRNGGYGNYVRLSHDNGVQTAYAHMSRFAKGITRGKRIRQGQVIGFVGTTGRSTGPHLHYEVVLNGKKVNPLTVKIAGSGRKLAGKELDAFRAERNRIDELRRSEPTTTLVAAAKD